MSNVIRYFPTQALNFATKDYYKVAFAPKEKNPTFAKQMALDCLSGGLAGATSLTIVYPLDFTRTRLATDTHKRFKGMGHCLTSIAKSDGICGLYRGFGISVVAIFFYRASFFGLYDTAKRTFPTDYKIIKLSMAFVVTTISGIIAYPIDSVRRRMMMQSGAAEKQYTSTVNCITKTYAKEGFNGFFKGCLSNVLRGAGASLVLVLYDEMQAVFNPPKK